MRGQDASGLCFGARRQSNPPRVDEEVAKLVRKGVAVFAVEEDVAERGILPAELIDGVDLLPRRAMARLLGGYDQVLHW